MPTLSGTLNLTCLWGVLDLYLLYIYTLLDLLVLTLFFLRIADTLMTLVCLNEFVSDIFYYIGQNGRFII